MTIEERLEKLTERHEALTQTVEITAGMQRANEELIRKNEEFFKKRLAETMDAINRLVHVAEIHERRLEDLEGH